MLLMAQQQSDNVIFTEQLFLCDGIMVLCYQTIGWLDWIIDGLINWLVSKDLNWNKIFGHLDKKKQLDVNKLLI